MNTGISRGCERVKGGVGWGERTGEGVRRKVQYISRFHLTDSINMELYYFQTEYYFNVTSYFYVLVNLLMLNV